ncbi:MAG: hypothetical protein LBQ19_04040 [Synergistaceae bacterium]|jgi:HK97 gp10 family phage protein|nr:hypothetical protein [Synergistaceae bacterium]
MLIFARLENDKEVLNQLRELREGALRERVFAAIKSGAEKIAIDAILRAPVLTGALAGSIKTSSSRKALSAKIYADYPDNGRVRKTKTSKQKAGSREYYAMAVEYGTKRVRAQPFLMPAAQAKAAEVVEGIEKAMEDALNDTVGSV